MVLCVVALLLVAATSPFYAFDIERCIAPLGMESGKIPDKDITASSCFHSVNVGPENARLNQEIRGGAWCPKFQVTTEPTEWLEIDLRSVHVITAVGTQGRFGNGLGQEYVESYVLEYWRPKLARWVRYRSEDENDVLEGNTNTYIETKSYLDPPIWASKVRFIPYSSHLRTVCLRVEIYGCYWNVGIVSYSMPKGDTRSNGVGLSDIIYDGRYGVELRGGLGQLVDGRFGGDEIREPSKHSAWVGWRNDTRTLPPTITFEFDKVREFRAVHIFCNNKFMRDVKVFSEALISFSIAGRHYQEDPISFTIKPDSTFEMSRNVSIDLHHRIGKWVRIQLWFSARWILISEIVFDSDVALGNHTPESLKPTPIHEKKLTTLKKEVFIPTVQQDDPLYVAIVVGVVIALVILFALALFFIVHRHRHRKCFASPIVRTTVTHKRPPMENYNSCGTSMLPDNMMIRDSGLDVKSDDYQEPYQSVNYAPGQSYSTVLLEMKDFVRNSNNALSDSSNYDYAVPELSSAPLLTKRHLNSLPERSIERGADDVIAMDTRRSGGHPSKQTHRFITQEEVFMDMMRRIEMPEVIDFPRHRLRMISKLGEGIFGSIYIAEADNVPDYNGVVTAEKRLLAVKFWSSTKATAAERYNMKEEFENEISMMSSLSSPLISRVIGAMRTPPLAVVQEYLELGDMCAFLRASPSTPLTTLLHLATQIAAGMEYLESIKFVHRDLAARNCVLGKNFSLKICDFGSEHESYLSDYYEIEGRVVSLRWAAWELVLRANYSTKSDVWAFAVTLFEIFTLCRCRPYEHLNDNEVLVNLTYLEAGDDMFECLFHVPGCPTDVFELMLECWRRDALSRPSFAEIHMFLQRKILSFSTS